MRLRILSSIFIILLCAGCGSGDKVPNTYLQPAKMQAVLWDMMRSDQFLADYVFSRDTAAKQKDLSFEMYSKIFAIHEITAEQFRSSFLYYHEHPKLLKEVLDSMSKTSIYPQAVTDTVAKPKTDSLPVTVDTLRLVARDSLLIKPKLKKRPGR